MNLELLRKKWEIEEEASFEGWDFSRINHLVDKGTLPWDYKELVMALLDDSKNILDMGTGGGEFLLTLNHPYEKTSVTEGYLPNYELCLKRLKPKGIQVEFVEEDDVLNYDDASFDLVINKHESFDLKEVYRVLKNGGYFITQQVGGMNNVKLAEQLIEDYESQVSDNVLQDEIEKSKAIGFELIDEREIILPFKFYDIGALVYFAKIISWEFEGFSVDACFDRLVHFQEILNEKGYIESEAHRYLLVLKK